MEYIYKESGSKCAYWFHSSITSSKLQDNNSSARNPHYCDESYLMNRVMGSEADCL